MTTFEKLFGDKFSKFRLGQLLFITAITFGLFMYGDIIRGAIAFLAFCCLSKEDFKLKLNLTQGQKIAGTFFILFLLWYFIVPTIFGENDLNSRLRNTMQPMEMLICAYGVLIFARDAFFVENLKRFAVLSCFLYALIALLFCWHTGFQIEFTDYWPSVHLSVRVGMLMVGLLPWMLYCFVSENDWHKKTFYLFAIIFAVCITILSRVSSFWVSCATEICVALILTAFISHRKVFSALLILFVALSSLFLSLYSASLHNTILKEEIFMEIHQLTSRDTKEFTHKRYDLWVNTIDEISRKPLLGHGMDVYNHHPLLEYCDAHNTFLQAAFIGGLPLALLLYAYILSLLVLAGKTLWHHRNAIIPFVLIVFIVNFMTVALVENLFDPERRILALLWSTFPLLLTQVYDYQSYKR